MNRLQDQGQLPHSPASRLALCTSAPRTEPRLLHRAPSCPGCYTAKILTTATTDTEAVTITNNITAAYTNTNTYTNTSTATTTTSTTTTTTTTSNMTATYTSHTKHGYIGDGDIPCT